MEKLSFEKYQLNFKRPAGTSRGVLNVKDTYFLILEDGNEKLIGECNLFKGLSVDDRPDYEQKLGEICRDFAGLESIQLDTLSEFPSIIFGVEQLKMWKEFPDAIEFQTRFFNGDEGILINGLVWMGDLEFMKKQIREKLQNGFRCLKLKIGVNWPTEHELLKLIRQEFNPNDLEIRVDANGAFNHNHAPKVLEQLSKLSIHSIEQPIKAGQWQEMAELCRNTPTPVALDEDLIGIYDHQQKNELLQTISPQYIILKPALIGGFSGSRDWIDLAEKQGIGWWVTSALESNIGLMNLGLWTAALNNPLPQGLGTGGLFTNNLNLPLVTRGERLWLTSKMDSVLFKSLSA